MSNRPHSVSIAFWTYVIPMVATRAMRIGLVMFGLSLLGTVLLFMSGLVAAGFVEDALVGMRHFLVMLGLPVGAVLLGEIPIRDGLTHRTLLYPMLGPVPRTTLVMVRVVTTAGILAAATAILLLIIRLMLGDGIGVYPRELLAVTLGAFAYVSLFGFIHLYNRRGLISGLAILFLFDMPLGRLPFTLRNISPSYHIGVLSDQTESMQLPVALGMPATSILMSSIVLLAIAVVFAVIMAWGFKRKDVGELC